MKKAIAAIAVISTICSAVFAFFAVIALKDRQLAIWALLGILLGMVAILVLLLAMFRAFVKIEKLENDIVKLNSQLEKPVPEEVPAEEEHSHCKECRVCGLVSITDEDSCPKCSSPYKESDEGKI